MADKLLAEWFWIDRWDGSSAALLPMEAQGIYRSMLTQAWRRGARLPNDHEAVRRAIRCTSEEWARCWPKVLRYWRVDGDALVNDTQLEVYAAAKAAQERASERGRKGAQARAQANTQATLKQQLKHIHKDKPKDKPPSPVSVSGIRTPSPEPSPTTDSASPGESPTALAVVEPKHQPWNDLACETFIRRYGGTAPGARITRALRPLVAKHGEDVVLAAWGNYLGEVEAEYVSAERFASTFGHWTGKSPPSKAAKGGTMAAAAEYLAMRRER